MFDWIKQVQKDYQRRLAAQGIPLDPAARTTDQEATAVVERWAAINEPIIQLGSLDPAVLES